METKRYDVFISFSTEDQKTVEGVCGFLERNGIRCFVSYRDIPKGIDFASFIYNAVKQSKMMVAVFSDNFNKSEYTGREISLASKFHIPILTFRIVPVEPTNGNGFFLVNLNWIDAFPEPEKYFGSLLENVKTILGIGNNHYPEPVCPTNKDPELSYSYAFMLGLRIGDFGLKNVGGTMSDEDVKEIKELLIKWKLPTEKTESLLMPGNGMVFLNSINDIIEEKWGLLYSNCAFLGTTYIFCMLAQKKGGDATSWNEKIIDICKKIGIPKYVYQRISASDAEGMINFRDAVRNVLDNLNNSVRKCPCCGSNIGFDYEICPQCGFSISKI